MRPAPQHPITASVLTFIQGYIERQGFAPTEREIAQHCYIGRATAHHHLNVLERDGYLLRVPHTARGIVLLQDIDKSRANVHLLTPEMR